MSGACVCEASVTLGASCVASLPFRDPCPSTCPGTERTTHPVWNRPERVDSWTSGMLGLHVAMGFLSRVLYIDLLHTVQLFSHRTCCCIWFCGVGRCSDQVHSCSVCMQRCVWQLLLFLVKKDFCTINCHVRCQSFCGKLG